jgi:DNA primase
MAGRIPPQFIDDLLNRVDIVEVVGRRVPLKKAGKDYQARCPFHDEKTPSFTVSADKQFYHCFGCGAHGSAIGFLMEYDNLDFVAAVEELADQAGLEVPREAGQHQGPELRPLHGLLEQAAGFYQRQLREHPRAAEAVDYLKQRGLSGEIAGAYGIGYAPPGWDNLLRHLGRSPATVRQLREAGLISESESQSKGYDRFRRRIMFPIRDSRGRVIGFGGRVLDPADSPKYLNSPETPVFHKGRELYGLYEAKRALRKLERLLVVEGYMDVVALAQYGIRNCVATLGTATTKEHLELVFRLCPEVVFCFDGDRAGRAAAWKALETSLPLLRDGREVRFLFLPEGEDPDSLVRREGTETFQQRLEDAMPLSKFLFQQLESQVHMDSQEGVARLVELANPLLQKLPTGVLRKMMFRHLEARTGLDPGSLAWRRSAPSVPGGRNPTGGQEYQKPRPTPIRTAIALLLDNPRLAAVADSVEDDWTAWNIPGIPLLRQLLEIIRSQPTLNKAALLERWRNRPEFVPLNKLASYRFDIPGLDPEAEFKAALQKLNQQYRQRSVPATGNLKPSELSEEALARLKQRFPGSPNPNRKDK